MCASECEHAPRRRLPTRRMLRSPRSRHDGTFLRGFTWTTEPKLGVAQSAPSMARHRRRQRSGGPCSRAHSSRWQPETATERRAWCAVSLWRQALPAGQSTARSLSGNRGPRRVRRIGPRGQMRDVAPARGPGATPPPARSVPDAAPLPVPGPAGDHLWARIAPHVVALDSCHRQINAEGRFWGVQPGPLCVDP